MIGTHSRAWSLAWISTPGLVPSRNLPIRSARTVYGPRGGSPAGAPVRFWSRKSVSAIGAAACTIPVPALVRYGCARSIRPCDGVSSAAATCAAVRGERARRVLGQQHADRLAGDLDAQRQVAPGRLTNSTVMSLPPSWPQAAELMTTAAWPVPPIVACALRW